MSVEVVSIGNEVLGGSTIDTNSAFISRVLKDNGYEVLRHSVYSDNLENLKNGLKESLSRSKIVIATGGLGLTFDDTTKIAVSQLFELPLEYNDDIAEDLIKRLKNISCVKELALLPKCDEVFPNSLGTSPGMAISHNNSVLILLPGVPCEMQEMLVFEVLGFLRLYFPVKTKNIQKKVFFAFVSELDIDPILRAFKKKHKNIQVGIYPIAPTLKVILNANEEDENKEKRILDLLQEELISKFSKYVFSTENEKISHAVHNALIEKKKTLSFAESCSGGALAAGITSIANSSKYFLGSVVAYSNKMKENILGVKEKTIKINGAVSIDVVEEMVEGVYKLTGSDYAVAISGIAGPSGGSYQKPVGTVCIAIKEKGKKIDSGMICVKGNRQSIIDYTVNFTFCLLWLRIFHNRCYFNNE